MALIAIIIIATTFSLSQAFTVQHYNNTLLIDLYISKNCSYYYKLPFDYYLNIYDGSSINATNRGILETTTYVKTSDVIVSYYKHIGIKCPYVIVHKHSNYRLAVDLQQFNKRVLPTFIRPLNFQTALRDPSKVLPEVVTAGKYVPPRYIKNFGRQAIKVYF